MWSSKVHRQLLLSTKRNISSKSAVTASHYDVLGITPKATQAEVKAAYYKLSKLHHPDTSSEESEDGDKFRLITEAYEVLGNYRSRQLYDKGLYGHSRIADTKRKDFTPDHPQMGFYKSRFDKSRVPSAQMSKGIYDFDEWARQHYSETFAKTNIKYKPQRKHGSHDPREVFSEEKMLKLSVLGILLVIMGFSSMSISNFGYDTPKPFSEISDKPA